MVNKIKVFLVDDHQIMLDGIKALLKNDKQIEIIGEFTRGSQVIEKLAQISPDIIITDIHMPEMNGIELTNIVRKNYPAVKILALSMSGEEGMITEMVDAGISGYVIKNTGKEELRGALLKIMKGEVYFSAEVASQLTKALMEKKRRADEPAAAKLTQREVQIVKLIAMEYSNEKIAKELFISERTVETHRKNIFRKSQTKSLIGLMKYAQEKKII